MMAKKKHPSAMDVGMAYDFSRAENPSRTAPFPGIPIHGKYEVF